MTTDQRATSHIARQNDALASSLPFSDDEDFRDATRGFMAPVGGAITDDQGTVVFDASTYDFLAGDAPDTVNPSLWRQSRLVATSGLFEVVEGIYQVRGLDLSNITFLEGDRGVVVVDPLISTQTASAALALYRQHRGERPVTGVIYTHSHADHFGGVQGVVDQADVDAGRVPILAPSGFVEHAVAENVFAGIAMSRRAGYMYGAALERGPRGGVGAGLGTTTSTGTVGLLPPTVEISETGQQETVDGIDLVFQMAPDSEAPSEMLFYLPQRRVLCTAEDATHTLHNVLTLRGALVRDPRLWSSYLTESIDLFGAEAEVAFASHHWPTWGNARVVEFLELQRDLYAYLHDQTLRLLNKGLVGPEIAEELTLPPALENAWANRGYYGSVSHNVKAIYQRYMGWFDGNPAHLWEHPPVEKAKRFVDAVGGIDAVLEKGRAAYESGDFRWAAELLNHAVFAQPDHFEARARLADTYEQLGYGSENGTWRNFFLSGAMELRTGSFGTPTSDTSRLVAHVSPTLLFNAMAVQVNGPAAWKERLTLDLVLEDTAETYRLRLSNGVLTHSGRPQRDDADATLRMPRAMLPAVLLGRAEPSHLDGDATALPRLLAVLDPGDPDFDIVTP